MLFFILVGGAAYLMYHTNQLPVKKIESDVERNIKDNTILLDVQRSQGSLMGIREGWNELMNNKFIPIEMDFNSVRQGAIQKFRSNVGLVDKHMVADSQINQRPADDFHVPLFQALSNWYVNATSDWNKPYTSYNVTPNGAVDQVTGGMS